MLDKNQWLAIGLLSGFAYILGKDRESFDAESFNPHVVQKSRKATRFTPSSKLRTGAFRTKEEAQEYRKLLKNKGHGKFGQSLRVVKANKNDPFMETFGKNAKGEYFRDWQAESFEAENLMKGQMENIYLVALGMAHQEILNGGERATMEIWFEGRPVMLAIDNAADYFAINPKVLQSRYDSHNFVEPDWRDEYHQALSALKESFPTWDMFTPKGKKRFDL
ncbi:hypothetical protein N9E05_04755 [Gammaproteobacteria bacterium]|nr:hypothetical protein [Gammaproteobacteria bacterium]